jgi:hypothetical protein
MKKERKKEKEKKRKRKKEKTKEKSKKKNQKVCFPILGNVKYEYNGKEYFLNG